MRNALFYVSELRRIVTYPILAGNLWLNKMIRPKQRHGKFLLLDRGETEEPGLFFTIVTGALDLVESKDRISYARLARNIEYILSLPTPDGLGWLFPFNKYCVVNVEKCQPVPAGFFNRMQTRIEFTACLLVFYAANVHLYKKRIPTFKSSRERRQKICDRRALRFAKLCENPKIAEIWEAEYNDPGI